MPGIDPFDPVPGDYLHQVLPPKAYPADLAELEERFVLQFPNSTRRRRIFSGFEQWVQDVSLFEVSLTVWVDGSFVEGKEDPDDLDLWSFSSGEEFLSLSNLQRTRFESLINGREKTKPAYSCHTLCFLLWPPGHPSEPLNERSRLSALKSWGLTRPVDKTTGKPFRSRYPKGFAIFEIGANAPSISTHGVWP